MGSRSKREFTGVYRFTLAILVLVSHFYEHNNSIRPVILINLGEVAVSAFFVLSGYYVIGSAGRYSNFSVFIIRRLGRLVPEFVVAIMALISVRFVLYESFEPRILLEIFSIFPGISRLFKGSASEYFTLVWALRLEVLSYLTIGMGVYLSKVALESYKNLIFLLFVSFSILMYMFTTGNKLSYFWLFGLGIVLYYKPTRLFVLVSSILIFFHGCFVLDSNSSLCSIINGVVMTIVYCVFLFMKTLDFNRIKYQNLDIKAGNLSYDIYIYQVVAFSVISRFKEVDYYDTVLLLIIIYILSKISKFLRKSLCI